jgi:ATP-dependent DNA ligase
MGVGDLPVSPPVKPMLAKAVDGFEALTDHELVFEPKWDGFRCIAFRHDDEIELGSRNERPLTRYFPEVVALLSEHLPARCVVDGELIVASGDHLDFAALQQRIHPAESRITMLADTTPAAFVAFDVLAAGEVDLRALPFSERRAVLEAMAPAFGPDVRLTPTTRDRAVAAEWFVRFEGAGLDGLIAKPPGDPYVENRRTQFKLKHTRTADVVVAGYRIHKDRRGVGSLLLGLYAADGSLTHMGVAASFTTKRRTKLLEELEEVSMEDPGAHPWAAWVGSGSPNRWNAGRDQSWTAVRPELVCEVKYGSTLGGRFRATTRFVRWRPDRDPASCTFDQLVEPTPMPLGDVFDP